MSGFFGSIMSSVTTDITTKSISAGKNNTTSDISVSHDNLSNYNNFTYSWNIDGIDSTIISQSNKITRITGKNITGNTRLYCRVTNVTTGVTYTTPSCNINWLEILSATTTSASRVYNGTSQAVTVISGVNGTFSGSTSVSGTSIGTFTTTISGTGDYSGDVIGTLTITPITLTATGTTVSRGYNGTSQTVTVITGVNGTFSGSTSVSGTNAGSFTTTISGTGNYGGSVIGTLTITPLTLTATGTTASRAYNGTSQTVTVISGVTGTYSGSTSVSGTNAGSFTTTISGTGNYGGSVIGTLTITPLTLTATGTTVSRTYNGTSNTVTVITGVNGTYSGSTSVSGINAGSYIASISGTGNYSGNITGTLTISPALASSSPAYGQTIYSSYDGSLQSRVVVFNLTGLSYTGNPIVSGANAGTYPSSVTLSGNYTGTLTGYLIITQAAGFISLFAGDSYPAGYTSTVLFSRYLQSTNASYVFTSSVSGPGAGDAYVQEGFGVESRSLATAGFVVTLTATINDPNYTASSSTTTITFSAYTPPSGGGGGGGGGTYEGGGGGGGTTYY